jgi:hypothetical protein
MLPTITGPRTNNLQTTSPVQATTDPILDPEVQLTSLEEEVVPPNDAPSNELVPPNAEEFSVFNNEEEKKEVEAPKDVPEVKQDSDEFDLGIVPEVPETTTDESLEIDLPAKEEEIERQRSTSQMSSISELSRTSQNQPLTSLWKLTCRRLADRVNNAVYDVFIKSKSSAGLSAPFNCVECKQSTSVGCFFFDLEDQPTIRMTGQKICSPKLLELGYSQLRFQVHFICQARLAKTVRRSTRRLSTKMFDLRTICSCGSTVRG